MGCLPACHGCSVSTTHANPEIHQTTAPQQQQYASSLAKTLAHAKLVLLGLTDCHWKLEWHSGYMMYAMMGCLCEGRACNILLAGMNVMTEGLHQLSNTEKQFASDGASYKALKDHDLFDMPGMSSHDLSFRRFIPAKRCLWMMLQDAARQGWTPNMPEQHGSHLGWATQLHLPYALVRGNGN